ncbi:MAG: hypothetical protein IT536_01480 [Hyphomicrobiales bacterium]|nr:hypothetical protein [Hyphomicrobiales bacterium]
MDLTRAQIARANRPDAAAARSDYYRALAERTRAGINPQGGVGAIPGAIPGVVPGAPSAVPDPLPPSAAPPVDSTTTAPPAADSFDDRFGAPAYARGGAVPAYAYEDGGVVDSNLGDDPDDDLNDDPNDDDLDDDPRMPAEPAPQYSFAAANNAARDGLITAARLTGISGQAVGGSPAAYVRGAGAASHQEMEAVRRAVDPHNRMSEAERNLAALSHVYEFHLKNNNPQGAQRAAASMMQYFRLVSGRYQALARAAAHNGDVDGATRAFLKSYANLPDGNNLSIARRPDGSYEYSVQDLGDDRVVTRGIATPQQVLQFATRNAMGFDEAIVRAAGARAARSSGTGDGTGGGTGSGTGGGTAPRTTATRPAGVRSMSERRAALDAVDAVPAVQSRQPSKDQAENRRAAGARELAVQILGANEIPAEEAVSIAREMVTYSGKPKFKVATAEDGTATVQLSGGRAIRLTGPAFQNFVAMRAGAFNDARNKSRTALGEGMDKLGLKKKLEVQKAEEQDRRPKKCRWSRHTAVRGETECVERLTTPRIRHCVGATSMPFRLSRIVPSKVR